MSDATTTPATVSTTPAPAALDEQRQTQAKAYARVRRLLGLADLGISGFALLLAVWLGAGLRLRDGLDAAGLAAWQPVAGWAPLLVGAVGAIVAVAFQVIAVPLSIYTGYVLPHRYGQSRQHFGGWLADWLKSFALGLVFLVALVEGMYVLLVVSPAAWWLWLAGALFFVSVVLANLAPVILVPLFYKQTPMPDGELRDRLLAMAARAGTRVRGVFVMHLSAKTVEGNAALMGLGNTRRIVVGDTILATYAPDEIAVILAHELGHQVHRDIWKLLAVNAALTLGGLALVNVGLRAAVATPAFGLRGLADVAGLPVLALILGVYGLVTGPLGNIASRVIERQADLYALATTRDPDHFISAFHRLANQNLSQVDPHPLVEALFYDHPAIGKRIQFAEQWRAAVNL